MTLGRPPVNLDYASPGVPPRRRRGLFGWVLFIGLAVMFFMIMRQGRSASGPTTSVTLGEFTLVVNTGELLTASVSDSDVVFTTTSKRLTSPSPQTQYRVDLPSGTGNDWKFLQWLTDGHNNSYASVTLDGGRQNLIETLLVPLIPWLFIFLFLWFFVFRQLRNQRGKPMPVVIVNPEAMQ